MSGYRYPCYQTLPLVLMGGIVTLVVITTVPPNRIGTMVMKQMVSSMPLQLSEDEVAIPINQIMKNPVTLEQDHPKLIEVIRSQFLKPPSTAPYNLKKQGTDDPLIPSQGQEQTIREIMGDDAKKGGFFIECGALDGETRSNTLQLEKALGWSGLLVEGDPKNYAQVADTNRKAWSVNACLSTKPYPVEVVFQQTFNTGQITDKNPEALNDKNHALVQCLPLYSLMLALNVTTIDYFSLDVEGVELEVLKTIPWDMVDIKTLSVEYLHVAAGKDVLKRYMEQRGYWVYKTLSGSKNVWANDFIFVKSTYKKPEDFNKS